MSATTDLYVTPSTSLVLLKNLSSPVNVYLPALTTPDFSVTIRDTTGLSSLLTQPVRISTIQGARFRDGSALYLLTQPYGLVNVSLRNSTLWQINHTSGQPPAASAADVGILSTGILTMGLLSSGQRFVSTLTVESLTTPNSISVTGPFVVTNLSTPGFVRFDQNLIVYGDTLLRGGLVVDGPVLISSSFLATDLLPLTSSISVSTSLGVGGSVAVGEEIRLKSTLSLRSLVSLSTLQVTKSTSDVVLTVTGSTEIRGLVSTLGALYATGPTFVAQSALFDTVSTTGGLVSTGSLTVGGSFVTLQSLSTLSTAIFGSSVHAYGTSLFEGSLTALSSLGTLGPLYTSSLSTIAFSTLGSLSTLFLELTSTASITGSLSTTAIESYSFFSVGGVLVTPAVVSSLGQTRLQGPVTAIGQALFSSLTISTSLGVGGSASILSATSTGSATLRGALTVGQTFQTSTATDILGSLVIRTTGLVQGDLTVVGGSEISSFLVQSFLLSNLSLVQSTPFLSFQVSSLNASTLRTEFTRISAGTLQISTLYASTLEAQTAIGENTRFSTLTAETLVIGSGSQLDPLSDPSVILGTKTQFAQGISTLELQVATLTAGRTDASLVGTVSYLSNVTAPFFLISGITMTLSTLTAQTLYTSSFTASTFVANKFMTVHSSLVVPYLVLEAQGYAPRFDVNQLLTVSSNQMIVNRQLFFDRGTNRIGYGISNPAYDLDISGIVYASNFYYSTINPITISSQGTTVFSTLFASSIQVQELLRVDGQGILITSLAGGTSTPVQIAQTQSSFSNLFGLYSAPEQSTLLVNAGIHVKADRKVILNGYTEATGAFVTPAANLEVRNTVETQSLLVSSLGIVESVQAQSFLSPYLTINRPMQAVIHTLSTTFTGLTVDSLLTIQNAPLGPNRRVGILTHTPSCALDVRGNAFFSSVTLEQALWSDRVAMGVGQM